jgi:hypothetical protein
MNLEMVGYLLDCQPRLRLAGDYWRIFAPQLTSNQNYRLHSSFRPSPPGGRNLPASMWSLPNKYNSNGNTFFPRNPRYACGVAVTNFAFSLGYQLTFLYPLKLHLYKFLAGIVVLGVAPEIPGTRDYLKRSAHHRPHI